MDENKLELLEEVYVVYPTCGLCKLSDINPDTDWGTCELLTYQHKKHTGPARQLSINRNGGCENFEPDPVYVGMLGHFQPLLVEDAAKSFIR